MSNEAWAFNGIDARTGDYLLELSEADLARVARGEKLEPDALDELKHKNEAAGLESYGPKQGLDPNRLEEVGWAVVFPATRPGSDEEKAQAAVREALGPLLRHRRGLATTISERYYREFLGPHGYRPGESKQQFLRRHGAGPGPADPEKVPYYLLLVGSPEEIPFIVQSQLSVQYAVGRLHFDTVAEYARYARNVVEAETTRAPRSRGAAFFGTANGDDNATQSSARELVGPLADSFAKAGWSVDPRVGPDATKKALSAVLEAPPALVFTASHGMGFPNGDDLQARHQGALLCQDWPGPKAWKKAIPESFYFSGDDLSSRADLSGSIAFSFACFGAGTPQLDEFYKQAFKTRSPIAPHPFVAALPKAMLGGERGALAVVGHVERAWGCSFLWPGTAVGGGVGRQVEVFESTLRSAVSGSPIGAAMEYFDGRYAELASDLSVMLGEADAGVPVSDFELANAWTANNDARGYAILGDPAVRLRLEGSADRRADIAPGAIIVRSSEPPAIQTVETVDAEAEGGTEQAFGIFDKADKPEKAEKADDGKAKPFQRFAQRLGELLEKALDDATSLEVTTWVAKDMGAATFQGGKLVGAELRAVTRIALDGDTLVCLPEKDGEVDTQVWALHAEMVRQAQQTRAELLKTIVSAAASLSGIGK